MFKKIKAMGKKEKKDGAEFDDSVPDAKRGVNFAEKEKQREPKSSSDAGDRKKKHRDRGKDLKKSERKSTRKSVKYKLDEDGNKVPVSREDRDRRSKKKSNSKSTSEYSLSSRLLLSGFELGRALLKTSCSLRINRGR